MSKILASIADAELGAARYKSPETRTEIQVRATAARAEHAEIVAFLHEVSEWGDTGSHFQRTAKALLSRVGGGA